MNSFSQLNTHGSQRVLVDDSRKAKIILDKTELTDLDQTFNLYPTYNSQAFDTKNYAVNIDEIINYATANAKLTATILPSNMVSTYNASLVFNVVSPVTLTKPAANIYQLTGFQNNIDWDNNVSFTFNYPQGYAGLGIWYVTFVLDWYDETTGRAKSVTWNFYNTGHYYYALLPSRFDINPRLGVIKRSQANFISRFEYKKAVQTSANLVDIFALRGFIELRLMRRSSAQLTSSVILSSSGTKLKQSPAILITPITFRAQVGAKTGLKSNLITPVVFAPKVNATFRSKSNLITAARITNRLFRVRKNNMSNQNIAAFAISSGPTNDVWSLAHTRNFSTSVKWVANSRNYVYYLESSNTISVYDWEDNFITSISPTVTISGRSTTLKFTNIRASDNIVFAFASVKDNSNNYLVKYVKNASGNYVSTDVIIIDVDGLAAYDIDYDGNFAYVVRSNRLVANKAGYTVVTNYNNISFEQYYDYPGIPAIVDGLSLSNGYLNILLRYYVFDSYRLYISGCRSYLLSNGSYSIYSFGQGPTYNFIIPESSNTAPGLVEYIATIGTHPTGGWFSYNSQMIGPVAKNRATDPNDYIKYLYTGQFTPLWPEQWLTSYASMNIAIVPKANPTSFRDTLIAYTNANDILVDAYEYNTDSSWPDNNLRIKMPFAGEYVFAKPDDGKYVLYGSGTQFLTYKKR